jgi:hypothetical protein
MPRFSSTALSNRVAGVLRPFVRLTALGLVAVGVGIAQDVISAKAGLVYFVLGRVSIVGKGQLTTGAANRQLNQGEVLFSEAGRAEVLLNPRTVLRMGSMTRIRIDSDELTDTHVSIAAGSAVVTVNQLPKLDRLEVHMGGAVVAIKSAGVYRFDGDSRDSGAPRLRVFSGQAEAYPEERASFENGAFKTSAKRGQQVRLQDLKVSRFDPKDTDALQQWAQARGAPPPWIPLPPMKCYSTPAKTSEIIDWMRDCAGR